MTIEQLLPLTKPFDIQQGELTGEGASFLKNVMSKAQYTMLGEYHGSFRISEFTKAIVPYLDSQGYKTMILEVGPITGNLLNAEHNDHIQKPQSNK